MIARLILHAIAALTAGVLTGTDPLLLLSIAHHESRWTSGVVSLEPGHRVSCGSMTPEPVRHCRSQTLLGEYVTGARHLRGWLDACHGHRRCALLGYAGGYALIRACATSGYRCDVADALAGGGR